MAQTSAPVYVEGNVVKSQRKNGSMPDRDNPNGAPIVWDYVEAKVLTPEYDSVEVRFPSDGSIPLPKRDDVVRLRCEARNASGKLRLTVETVEVLTAA